MESMFECSIPINVMEDPEICLGAKGFYAYLFEFRGDRDFASPGSAQILKDLSMSSWDVVRKYTKELEARGYLMTSRDLSIATGKGNRRIEYRLAEPSCIQNKCEKLTRVVFDNFCPVEAKGLFTYFAVHADLSGKVILSRERILKDLNCSKTTYTKYAAELERLNFLKRGRYYDEAGRAAGILYDLTT